MTDLFRYSSDMQISSLEIANKTKPTIAVVVPSWHYWIDPLKIQPLHEMHYATVIQEDFPGIEVEIIDLRGIPRDQQVSHIHQRDIFLYWIMKAGDYTEIKELVSEVKLLYPESLHMAGGTHIEMTIEESSTVFDIVIKSGAENKIHDVIESWMIGAKQEKVLYGDFNECHWGKYPFMNRDHLPESSVVNTKLFSHYGSNIRSTCVLFSRGCSLKCAYCVYNVPNAIHMKPLDVIRDEILYLKDKYDVAAINLKDEVAIPFKKKDSVPYLETIKETGIMWRGQTTVYGASTEILKLAGESGCVELATGIESSSPLCRNIVNKKMSDESIKRFIDDCHSFGIKVKMCLVLGLPGEQHDIADQTIEFIEDMAPDYVAVSGLDPFPGSQIFNNQDYYGIKSVDYDWGNHAHLLYRFSDEEEAGVPFEYHEENQWGKTLTRKEIVGAIKKVQKYARDQELLY